MISAPQLLWAHLSPPSQSGCVEMSGPCWVCGSPWDRGLRRDEWQGENFTGQNKVRCPSSNWVCEACAWATAGRPPDTLRMYSHFFDGVDYRRLNKGDKPVMRDFLRRKHARPWFAAIADSGQKHVLPWTPVNPVGAKTGRVLFEEQLVTLGDWQIVDDTSELLTLGATKEEIERGSYGSRAWQLCHDQIVMFEEHHGSQRGGSWFALVVWLAQRDEEQVQARLSAEKETKRAKSGKGSTRTPRKANGVAADGAPESVSRRRRQPDETLGSNHGPSEGSGENERERPRVDDVDVQKPTARRSVQGSLFGDRIADGSGD